ncbi:Mor transcription activator family protein [Rheinheimera sp.]|uniref:Mor transcription activator family protein n=1 Tax=Rheinheimera sp. TaxID=1869214 RepID=UPI00307E97C1
MSEMQLDAFADSEDLQQVLQELDKVPADQRAEVMRKVPALLQSLVEIFGACLKSQGLKEPQPVAEKLVITLAEAYGGIYTYLPRNEKLKAELRNIRMYREFNGRNVDELAQRYDITTVQVYAILREQTLAEKARRQMKLF